MTDTQLNLARFEDRLQDGKWGAHNMWVVGLAGAVHVKIGVREIESWEANRFSAINSYRVDERGSFEIYAYSLTYHWPAHRPNPIGAWQECGDGPNGCYERDACEFLEGPCHFLSGSSLWNDHLNEAYARDDFDHIWDHLVHEYELVFVHGYDGEDDE